MEPASTIYEAALAPHANTRTRVRLRVATTVGEPELPSLIDLVVRRRDDGAEIVRTPADLGSPDDMLATVETDLRRMTADEFLQEWKMPERI